MATYYFDGSDAAATDPGSVWTFDADAFDASLANAASCGTNGTISSNFLMAEGTNAPTSGNEIASVRVRAYTENSGAVTVADIAVYTDGLGELLGILDYKLVTTPPAYSSYLTLNTPTGGWDYSKVAALEVKCYATGLGFSTLIYRIDVEVTEKRYVSVPTNINGGTKIRPAMFKPGLAR